MKRRNDKAEAMKTAGQALNDQWDKEKITPEKNEDLMREKIGQIIQTNRKKGFSLFR
jgi:hypothetical protein